MLADFTVVVADDVYISGTKNTTKKKVFYANAIMVGIVPPPTLET